MNLQTAALALAAFTLAITATAAEKNAQTARKAGTSVSKKSSSKASSADADAGRRADVAATKGSQAGGGKLTIMEFGDLQCPDTAEYVASGRAEIMAEFVKTGKAEYTVHDFPLDAHPLSRPAAEAARCAGAGGNRLREQLLQNINSVQTERDILAQAQAAGADPQEVGQCMQSGASARAVQQDAALGRKYGVHATPSLVVGFGSAANLRGAKVIRADRPLEQVKSEIAAVLASGGGQ